MAILSSLVAGPGGIGAWASHIFINATQAVCGGRHFWELPAEMVTITDTEAAMTEKESETLSSKTETGLNVEFGEDKILWTGWSLSKAKTNNKGWDWFDVSLPSFSGHLPIRDNDDTMLRRLPSLLCCDIP